MPINIRAYVPAQTKLWLEPSGPKISYYGLQMAGLGMAMPTPTPTTPYQRKLVKERRGFDPCLFIMVLLKFDESHPPGPGERS